MASPALAKCSKDCKKQISAEFKACKTACGKKDKVCKKACTDDKKEDKAKCKGATPPACSPSGAFLN